MMQRVEEEEKELNHFSHQKHPLILSGVEKKAAIDDNDDVGKICSGCGEAIMELQAYICSHCDFFLHKRCAKLPPQMTHPKHSQHPLVLLKIPPYKSQSCFCDACRRSWKFFTYHCSLCGFDLDVFCSDVGRRSIDHKGHEHPLVFQSRPATLYCNACTRECRDSSYFCITCPSFWVHQTCASLPETVYHKRHMDYPHPLSLAYNIPYANRPFNRNCSDCRSFILPFHWVFYCGPCRYYIHLKCLLPTDKRFEELDTENDELRRKKLLLNLPMEDPTPNLLSRSFPQKTEANILHPAHNHMLYFSVEQPTQNDGSIICSSGGEGGQTVLSCEGCFEPIIPSDPHYKCTTCNYFLHVACQNLPTQLQILRQLHPHPLSSLDTTANYVASGTLCDVCWTRCNGISYTCSTCPSFHVCVKCLAAAFQPSVVHKTHKHILNRNNYTFKTCKACGKIGRTYSLAFGCEKCSFSLDIRCCLLPPTVRDRRDKHLLILMFPPYFDHPDKLYCQICVEEMDPNLWMYHCRECNRSFHLCCLPQIKFRNMKLGRNLVSENHTAHPLISVLIPRNYKPFCVDCGRRLYEDMALECSPCRFYLCMDCSERRGRNKEKKYRTASATPTQAKEASSTSTGGDSESD